MNLGIRHETRLMASESTSWILLLVYVVLSGYGAIQGVTAYRSEQDQITATRREYDLRWETITRNASASRAELWGSWKSPSLAGSEQGGAVAWIVPSPLSALNRGHAARESPVRRISLFDSPIAPPLANPVNVMYGWMDFGFSVLWLLPLVQLLLSFQSLGRDRELGLWPLVLSSGVPLRRLVAVRLAIPYGIVVGITLLFGATIVAMTAGRFGAAFLEWAVALGAYASFWTLLGGTIALGSGNAARQLLLLAGIWIGAVWVVPGLLDGAAAVMVPRRNIADGLLAARDAQISTAQRSSSIMKQVYERHPEWKPTPEHEWRMNQPVPGGPRKRDSRGIYSSFLAGDEALAPSRALAARRRAQLEDLSNRFSPFSPVTSMQYITEELAGTSFGRYKSFDMHAEEFLAEWRQSFASKVWKLEEMRVGDIDRRPRFLPANEQQPAAVERLLWPVGGLTFWILCVSVAVRRRLRHFQPV
jgi:hypothetical protein